MKIKELMNPHVWSVRADATLDAATRIMWDEDLGALPVVDEWNHPIGMVTDRDIAMSAAINGRPLAQMTVAQCMSRQVHHCEEADSLEAAAGVMRAHQVRRVPIVDEEQRLVGLLTLSDLAQAVSRPRDAKTRRALADEVVRTIAAVCEPRDGHRETESEAVVEVRPAQGAPKAAAPKAAKPARKKAAGKKTTRRKSTR
jgi:predicted transcriptional regulator